VARIGLDALYSALHVAVRQFAQIGKGWRSLPGNACEQSSTNSRAEDLRSAMSF
jgi:hypothetical protein